MLADSLAAPAQFVKASGRAPARRTARDSAFCRVCIARRAPAHNRGVVDHHGFYLGRRKNETLDCWRCVGGCFSGFDCGIAVVPGSSTLARGTHRGVKSTPRIGTTARLAVTTPRRAKPCRTLPWSRGWEVSRRALPCLDRISLSLITSATPLANTTPRRAQS